MNFNNLATRDIEGAKAFYGAVFGWKTLALPQGTMWALPGYGDHLEESTPGLRQQMAQMGGPEGFIDVVAAVDPIAKDDHQTPAHWRVVFAVDEVNEATASAKKLGGQVVRGPLAAPWTKVAVINDPKGATFTVSQFVFENKDLTAKARSGKQIQPQMATPEPTNAAEHRRWNDDYWASVWPRREQVTGVVTELVLDHAYLAPGARVLDIGSGAGISPHGTFWHDLAGPFFVAGMGTAFAFIPVSIGGLAGVAERDAGVASGLLNTSQQLGVAIGVAVASSIAASRFDTLIHHGHRAAAALSGGFASALWVCGLTGLVAVPVAFVLVRGLSRLRRRRRSNQAAAAEPSVGELRPIGSTTVAFRPPARVVLQRRTTERSPGQTILAGCPPEPHDRVTLAKGHGHAVDLSLHQLLSVAIQEDFNGFSSELVVGKGDARQPWPHPRRNGLIVERHHRHVLADFSARVFERMVCTEGEPVVEADEGLNLCLPP